MFSAGNNSLKLFKMRSVYLAEWDFLSNLLLKGNDFVSGLALSYGWFGEVLLRDIVNFFIYLAICWQFLGIFPFLSETARSACRRWYFYIQLYCLVNQGFFSVWYEMFTVLLSQPRPASKLVNKTACLFHKWIWRNQSSEWGTNLILAWHFCNFNLCPVHLELRM